MNPTDILTEILRGGLGGGRPSPGGGKPSPGGGDIFRDIFGGGRSAGRRDPIPPPPTEQDVARQARELEDLLGVGSERRGAPSDATPEAPPKWSAPAPGTVPPPLPPSGDRGQPPGPARQDAEAQVLIRAMIHAAKADGRLNRDERDAILKQLGGASREAVEFLRRELDTMTDVRDFAWSVPLGMEYKVYTISLSAIDLDSKAESDYLRQLAHGLRLPAEVCAHIHQRYGTAAPSA